MTLINRTNMAKRLIEEKSPGYEKHPHVIEFRKNVEEVRVSQTRKSPKASPRRK